MVYNEMPFITIEWDEAISVVIMNWRSSAKGEDFKTALNTGLNLIKEKKSKRWLANMQKMGAVGAAEQEWSSNDWFPRALAAGITYMALVIPESAISEMTVENIMSKVEGTNLVTHYFSDVSEAKKWLASQK